MEPPLPSAAASRGRRRLEARWAEPGAPVPDLAPVSDPDPVPDPASVPVSVPLRSSQRARYLGRLRERERLLGDMKRLCGFSLCSAACGLLLMIVQAEMCRLSGDPDLKVTLILSCSISISTLSLLASILAFHYKDVKLLMLDHCQVDWWIGVTWRRAAQVLLELLVCSVHPVGTYWALAPPTNSSLAPPPSACPSRLRGEPLPTVERLASVLMFLRLYLLHRAVLLNSELLLSASYRSIGSLNHIQFSVCFVLKILLNKYPVRMLSVFMAALWISASWTLSVCERDSGEPTSHMVTAMWLIAVTFLTVGYGDVSPITGCGKAVCLLTGLLGVACTAMLVAVITKRLALTRGEECVHHFMLNIQSTKQLREAAADVLKKSWLLHRASSHSGRGHRRRLQRRFLQAIRRFRHVRLEQQKLRESSSEMEERSRGPRLASELSSSWSKGVQQLEQRLQVMEEKLSELTESCDLASELLYQVLQQHHQEHRCSTPGPPAGGLERVLDQDLRYL